MSQKESEKFGALPKKVLAGWQIVSVTISCLLAEWFVLAFFGKNRWVVIIPAALALWLMISSHRLYGESPRELGFRLDNFVAACRVLLIPTALSLFAVLALSWLMDGSLSLKPLRPRYMLLPLWALFQQYALQGFLNRRSQIIWGKGIASVLLVAALFALLHLPNLGLAGVTFIGGAVLAAAYQRYPNLFAVSLSHALVSLFMTLSSPASAINSLRVGFKFFG